MAEQYQAGELRPARPEDYITKLTAVGPAPRGTPAPEWERFLDTTFPLRDNSGPDHELIAFLKRWAGYCLTGLTTEHKFLFLYGSGRNGKNVFADTLFNIAGDYAVRLPAEALMERKNEPHRAELMPMRGARLIVSNEIPKGATWNQARLMAITSGDLVTANWMRGNPVTFPVIGKLMVVGNNKPQFQNRNAAARDRLLLVHFRMRFKDLKDPNEPTEDSDDTPPERIGVRDPALADRLRSEWPAILRWMIDGCLEWQRIGLHPPNSVLAESAESLTADDFFIEWKTERCQDTSKNWGHDPISLLHRSYIDWADARRLRSLSRPQFSALLDDHDIERHPTKKGFCPFGFELSAEERSRITGQRDLG